MAAFIAAIATATVFAMSSVAYDPAGATLGGAPTIGLMEAWLLIGTGTMVVAWRFFSRPA